MIARFVLMKFSFSYKIACAWGGHYRYYEKIRNVFFRDCSEGLVEWFKSRQTSLHSCCPLTGPILLGSHVENQVNWRISSAPVAPGWGFWGCPPRLRANMAHIRQSRPDSGIGYLGKVLQTVSLAPSSHGSGLRFRDCTPPPSPRCISQNVLSQWLHKVTSPTKSSIYCLLLLIKTTRWPFCGCVDILKPFNRYSVWNNISGKELLGACAVTKKVTGAPRP